MKSFLAASLFTFLTNLSFGHGNIQPISQPKKPENSLIPYKKIHLSNLKKNGY
jgi:hypothetical protein